MTELAIAVHVHTDPQRLADTLDSIARHTTGDYESLVIPTTPTSSSTRFERST